ncbi:hypothetical protein FQB35_10270 [Crassaminicella thermophila]|uniref:tRNA_anti-like n=1 Tax=Crassaminicella thermophila TaxID=2599308 RepID=A0A5C0SDQ6_CRATE|nr:DUF3221 domain-containing protein [Crassaminicella thermophila]QEK12683.1 hypothetical protein FQB35_10270 [Crassaminicella thermophila]
MKRKAIVSFIILLCIMGFTMKLNQKSVQYLKSFYSPVEYRQEKVKEDNLEMITGKIKKIIIRDGKRSLLIEDSKGIEYIFHINENTIVITFEKLKIGQNVDIIFNGILTRSIPPQGTAMIVNGLKV